MNNWIRENVNFTKYDKTNDDIIVLQNSNDIESEFLSYAESYYNAGYTLTNYLVTDICNNGDIAKLDCWFFAVAYLFRQSLELILKAALLKFNVGSTKIISDVRHNLAIGIDLMNNNVPSEVSSNPNFKWLVSYFHNISEIDSESDMFRYPFNSKMIAFVKQQIHLDYISIAENVERAFSTLQAIINNSLLSYKNNSKHNPIFLIEGGHYHQQAVIGYKFAEHDFYPYIKSYTECANYLYKKIKSNSELSNLFLPMCYLFRNAIELELKNIYLKCCILEDAEMNLHKFKHRILKLWTETKDVIEKYSNAPPEDTTLLNCEKYIIQLNNWDGCSSKFRYPINKNFDFFFKREKRYNLDNVTECFNDICYFFDCVEAPLSQVLDFKAEIQAEYSQYDYDYDY